MQNEPVTCICVVCGADFPEGAPDSHRNDEQDDLCPDCGREHMAQIAAETADE